MKNTMKSFLNPFRPGAGQLPPHLAGRQKEVDQFLKILGQNPILKNLVITGLRGVGKTVLLDELKSKAISNSWFWAGTDLSESASISEQNLSIRIMTDLSTLISTFSFAEEDKSGIGFARKSETVEHRLGYPTLFTIYTTTPGLEADKLKAVFEFVWNVVKAKVRGIVLAYDEAQILKDRAEDKQYPLSLLLELFQYMQRKDIPYLLVLTGLPTLVNTLSEARTYSERMFEIITLKQLTIPETRDAILIPIKEEQCPVTFSEYGINEIVKHSSGYPYFIQFYCKEAFDSILQQINVGVDKPRVVISDYVRKLDVDFYANRWSRVTDRQRELLIVIARLPTSNQEFTAKEISEKSEEILDNSFAPAYVVNSLNKLTTQGLIFKNRRGKYSFAVPLLADYINRNNLEEDVDGLLF
jgi:hypothetical protein